MTWWTLALIYLGVFLAIQLLVALLLRREPTAHGRIVGTQAGCCVGAIWPIALVYFVIVGIGAFVAWAWSVLTRKGRP
jgi:hypothetical protein